MARIGELDQVPDDDQAAPVAPPRTRVVESCVSGAPAYDGICVEHGESACVMTLHLPA